MEHNPGGNPAMHPGMQPAGVGGQVCRQGSDSSISASIHVPGLIVG